MRETYEKQEVAPQWQAGGIQEQEAKQTTTACGIQVRPRLMAKADSHSNLNKNPTSQALPCNPERVLIETQHIKYQRGPHDSSELTAATQPASEAKPLAKVRRLWGQTTAQGKGTCSPASSETTLPSNEIKPPKVRCALSAFMVHPDKGRANGSWGGTQPSGTRAHVARGGADCVPVPWTSRKTCRMTQYKVPRQGLPCGRGTAEVECNGAMDSNGGAPGHDVET